MFTGLVEEIGEISSIESSNLSLRIGVKCKKVLRESKLGDSIATNGTCLTIINLEKDYFKADIMHESLKRTNLKRLSLGDKVNLERAVSLSAPLGGHLVTGDIDGEGVITDIYNDGIAKIYVISIKSKLMKYIVEKGRVTLDGASLTVVDFDNDSFKVSLIPHTQKMITLGEKKVGDYINVETDIVGKYIDRILFFEGDKENSSKNNISKDFLVENGFY